MVQSTSRPTAQPYRCRHCSRVFARSEHLTRHERTHTKEKPFRCGLCPQAFSRRDMLRRHESKAHGHQRTSNPDVAGQQHSPSADESNERSSKIARQSWDHRPLLTESTLLPLAHGQPISSPRMADLVSWMGHSIDGSLFDPLSQPTGFLEPCIGDSPRTFHDATQSSLDDFANIDLNFLQQAHPSPGHQDHMFQDSSGPLPPTDRHFSLTSAPVIDGEPFIDHVSPTTSGGTARNSWEISEEYYKEMQERISSSCTYILPSRKTLCDFIDRYFSSFHRHQPFLHKSTWSPTSSPFSLVLALCANGAVYNLEYSMGQSLFEQATFLLSPKDDSITALQTMMPLIAFAAWTENSFDLASSFPFHTRVGLTLGRIWDSRKSLDNPDPPSWDKWLELESLKRVTYCIATVLNLIAVAYDISPPLQLEQKHGLPTSEALWTCATEQEWIQTSNTMPRHAFESTEDIIQILFDPSLPPPKRIGSFGCHVVILNLLQKVYFLQKSLPKNLPSDDGYRLPFIQALCRWKLMWESEPEAALSPDHASEPILFNCTALFRLTYVRIAADFSDVRKSFGHSSREDWIVEKVQSADVPGRSPRATKAAFQACQALHIPSQLGFRLVSKTKFWIWSVQHALSYFECALLLSKWLQVIEGASDLSSEELEVLNMVRSMIQASSSQPMDKSQPMPSHITILYRLAELIDTGETTVWKIVPRMARVLRAYAEKISHQLNSV